MPPQPHWVNLDFWPSLPSFSHLPDARIPGVHTTVLSLSMSIRRGAGHRDSERAPSTCRVSLSHPVTLNCTALTLIANHALRKERPSSTFGFVNVATIIDRLSWRYKWAETVSPNLISCSVMASGDWHIPAPRGQPL